MMFWVFAFFLDLVVFFLIKDFIEDREEIRRYSRNMEDNEYIENNGEVYVFSENFIKDYNHESRRHWFTEPLPNLLKTASFKTVKRRIIENSNC